MDEEMRMFGFWDLCTETPMVGDLLIIETKRNKGVKVAVVVKEVVYSNLLPEVILQKGKNKYFNFEMYLNGDSWVYKCWNLGKIKLTAGLNNKNQLDDC